MRAYSHQGHGPRADQPGRIHISDSAFYAQSLLRNAAGPYKWSLSDVLDIGPEGLLFLIGDIGQGERDEPVLTSAMEHTPVIRSLGNLADFRQNETTYSRTRPWPPTLSLTGIQESYVTQKTRWKRFARP